MLYELLWFILGGGTIGGLTTAIGKKRHGARRRQDEELYKTQWAEAVELLGEQGQLTEEQVKRIMAGASQIKPASPTMDALITQIEAVRSAEGLPPLSAALKMSSSDRRRVEVTRAQQGLPPADTLERMSSTDTAAVLEARAAYHYKQPGAAE